MDSRRQRYLDAMGIPVWVRRDRPPVTHAAAPGEAPVCDGADPGADPGPDDPAATLAAIAEEVAGCTACALHTGRTQTVFGVGDPRADWMLVGEGPGAEEDRQGEPFVGRAGQLLNAMLRGIGLERDAVYIANIVKCRPPRNRDPRPEEMACCTPYLRRQIDVVRPRLILALGRIAAQYLLDSSAPLGRLRGRRYTFLDTGVPVVATYHPAYLLRSPEHKRRAWEDLCFARSIVAGPGQGLDGARSGEGSGERS